MIGEYRLGELVGTGGTSMVWRAEHPHFDDSLALKVLTGQSAHDPRFREYLANEMRAVARLNHPGIARIVDSGVVSEAAASEHNLVEDAPFIAMEFVSGRTLEDVIDELDWNTLKAVLRTLLDSLAHAHALGVIHLDIKPGNVLLREHGRSFAPVLTDFGIAQTEEREEAGRDEVTSVTGTPNYMAPEQIQGEWRDVGPWTDLYSLGCVAFRIISGRAPFDGPSTYAILHGHLLEEVPDLVPRIGIPRGVIAWLETLLRKSPGERYQRAAHAAWALHQIDESDWIEGASSPAPHTVDGPTFVIPTFEISGSRRALTRGHWRPPPLPLDWRRRNAPTRDSRGVGLSLVRHLRPSLIGYQSVRDQCWSSLESSVSGNVEIVEIEGVSGSGASHCAQWCAFLADEVGAAAHIVVRYRARSGVSALEAALAREFGVSGMSREKALPRIRDRLADSETFDEGDLLDTVLLTDLLVESSSRMVTEEERRGVLSRVIARLAATKPLVLVLDDFHHAPGDLAVIRDLVTYHSKAPILVLATTNLPLDWQVAVARKPLEKLERSELREVVSQLVDLESSALELALDVADGRPGTAVRIVTSWVERGVLRHAENGYELEDASTLESASEAEDKAAREILDLFYEDEKKAVVAAALIGVDFSIREWRGVTNRLGLELQDDFLERAIRHGLVGRDDIADRATYAFTGEELHRGVISYGSNQGWKKPISGACADYLTKIHRPLRNPALLERVGQHLFEAGRYDEALELVGIAAIRYHHHDMNSAARRLVEWHRDILRLASDEAASKAQPLARVADLWVFHSEGGEVGADEAREVQLEAHRAENWLALGEAARLRAKILRSQSFEASNEVLEEAATTLVKHGERGGLGTFWLGIGWNRGLQGDFDVAYPHLDRAERVFEEEGDRHWLGQTLRARAYLMIQEGNLAGARRMLDRATELARGSGDRMNVGGSFLYLGEIARTEGNYGEAARNYSKALEVYTLDGSTNVAVTRFNLALCEIGRSRFEAARLILEDLEESGAARRAKISDYVGLAFGPIFAAGARWRELDEEFVPAIKKVRRKLHAENDFAWLCEVTGNLAEDAGETERARFAWTMSAELWSALGREEDAERLRARVENH